MTWCSICGLEIPAGKRMDAGLRKGATSPGRAGYAAFKNPCKNKALLDLQVLELCAKHSKPWNKRRDPVMNTIEKIVMMSRVITRRGGIMLDETAFSRWHVTQRGAKREQATAKWIDHVHKTTCAATHRGGVPDAPSPR